MPPNDDSDKKFSLKVKYSTNPPLEDEWPASSQVKKVRSDAGRHFGIQQSDVDTYKILWERDNGTQTPLSPSDKLKDVGLADGACLILQTPTTDLGS